MIGGIRIFKLHARARGKNKKCIEDKKKKKWK